MKPGPVMLQNFVRQSKHDYLVSEVQLTELNSIYAHVKFPSSREANVFRDLAPCPPVNNNTLNERNFHSHDKTSISVNMDSLTFLFFI